MSTKGVFGESATAKWRLKVEVCVTLTLQQNVTNKACSYDEYRSFAYGPDPLRCTRQFRERLMWSRRVWRYWSEFYSKVPLIKFVAMMNIDPLHMVRTPADAPGSSGRGWCGAGESGGTGVYFTVKYHYVIKFVAMMKI